MSQPESRESWDAYRERELARVAPALHRWGYTLSANQVHISGERYLMSGHKVVLVATRDSDGARVIVKASSDPRGKEEIAKEHELRLQLPQLPFAYHTLLTPLELRYETYEGTTIAITEFIEEEKGFLEYSLREQFFLALNSLKQQEGFHAVARSHARAIRSIFGIYNAREYLASFDTFCSTLASAGVEAETTATLEKARVFLRDNRRVIEQYSGFLTHTDFVPHNLRVAKGRIYLLDHSALHFANKYESWARLLNYLTLYHPALETALSEYVRANRAREEYLSLRLMRAYKIGFLIAFYAENLGKTSGDLHALSIERVRFWSHVLEAILADRPVPPETIAAYRQVRDSLRSDEEKERQRALKQL